MNVLLTNLFLLTLITNFSFAASGAGNGGLYAYCKNKPILLDEIEAVKMGRKVRRLKGKTISEKASSGLERIKLLKSINDKALEAHRVITERSLAMAKDFERALLNISQLKKILSSDDIEDWSTPKESFIEYNKGNSAIVFHNNPFFESRDIGSLLDNTGKKVNCLHEIDIHHFVFNNKRNEESKVIYGFKTDVYYDQTNEEKPKTIYVNLNNFISVSQSLKRNEFISFLAKMSNHESILDFYLEAFKRSDVPGTIVNEDEIIYNYSEVLAHGKIMPGLAGISTSLSIATTMANLQIKSFYPRHFHILLMSDARKNNKFDHELNLSLNEDTTTIELKKVLVV